MTSLARGGVLMLVAVALAAAGCSRTQNKVAKDLAVLDVEEEAPAASSPAAAAVPIGTPQIAYTYGISYAFTDRAAGDVQARQAALCERLGPARCLVTKSDSDTARSGYVTDMLHLSVDARLAAALGARLDAIATAAGGTVAGHHRSAEDVTKQIIDTDARVRAKQALADRLLALIRDGRGKVGDLVEAERAFAATQEELDAARSMQAELRQRVRMSDIEITYTTDLGDGGWSKVSDSIGSAGRTLATSVAALLTFVVAALPWVLLLSGVVWLLRRIGWPRRRRRRPDA